MKKRIYTYKITFEEIPHWYWGVHKEKRFGEIYLGSPVTHRWMWEFYTPKIQILELFPCTEEGWKQACEVERRLIRPDLNNPLCLNESAGGTYSLEMRSRAGKIGASVTNAKLTKEERRANGVKGAQKANEILTPEERSENGKRGAAAAFQSISFEQRRLNSSKGGKKRAEMGLPEGRRFTTELGRELGKQGAEKVNRQRKEEGTLEKYCSMAGKVGGKVTSSQRWMCTVTGHVSNAAALARWQKARGIDTSNRVRLV